MRLRKTTGELWDQWSLMRIRETNGDQWGLTRLRETNGESWGSERLLECHDTNGESWDSETNGDSWESEITGNWWDQWRLMSLRETTGSSSLSESQESLVVSIILMSPHWSALVSDYHEVPRLRETTGYSWDSERLMETKWYSWDSERPMETHEAQRDYRRIMRPMGTHENQRD